MLHKRKGPPVRAALFFRDDAQGAAAYFSAAAMRASAFSTFSRELKALMRT